MKIRHPSKSGIGLAFLVLSLSQWFGSGPCVLVVMVLIVVVVAVVVDFIFLRINIFCAQNLSF